MSSILASGKTGEGVDKILSTIINKLPSPSGIVENKLSALLVDSWYDSYLGVVTLVRVIDGKIKEMIKL